MTTRPAPSIVEVMVEKYHSWHPPGGRHLVVLVAQREGNAFAFDVQVAPHHLVATSLGFATLAVVGAALLAESAVPGQRRNGLLTRGHERDVGFVVGGAIITRPHVIATGGDLEFIGF